ncbi:MAG: CDP-alcohol phosphatidyltransferase family protein [Patescibacteria group bacterium]
MSNKAQKQIDRFWQNAIFQFLPHWVSPNHFTFVRLALIPLVLALISAKAFIFSLSLFVLAALCDSIDGALARERKMVTAWGLILDPIADKLLIILASLFLAIYYPWPNVLIAIVLLDFLMILGGVALAIFRPKKNLPPADFWGKGKMVFQSAGMIAIFLFLAFDALWLGRASLVLLLFAIIFALVSLANYGVKAVIKI